MQHSVDVARVRRFLTQRGYRQKQNRKYPGQRGPYFVVYAKPGASMIGFPV